MSEWNSVLWKDLLESLETLSQGLPTPRKAFEVAQDWGQARLAQLDLIGEATLPVEFCVPALQHFETQAKSDIVRTERLIKRWTEFERRIDEDELCLESESLMQSYHFLQCAWFALDDVWAGTGGRFPEFNLHHKQAGNAFQLLTMRLQQDDTRRIFAVAWEYLNELRARFPSDAILNSWWYLRPGGLVEEAYRYEQRSAENAVLEMKAWVEAGEDKRKRLGTASHAREEMLNTVREDTPPFGSTEKARIVKNGVARNFNKIGEQGMKTWLYFASKKLASLPDTLDLAMNGYIWRSGYYTTKKGFARIPNTSTARKSANELREKPPVSPGDRLVLLYENRPLGIFRILSPDKEDGVPDFPAIAFFPKSMDQHLLKIDYLPDPILKRFVGFLLDASSEPGDDAIWKHGEFDRRGHGTLQELQWQASPLSPKPQTSRGSPTKSHPDKPPTFKSLPTKPQLPPVGAKFLGVDVGFALHDETLGFCVLERTATGLGVCPGNYGKAKLADFLAKILPELLEKHASTPFLGIALDGPLTPVVKNSPPFYRPQEQFLLRGQFPKRIKAQPYQSPIGKNLYDSAMKLRKVCETFGYTYEPFSNIMPGFNKLILESFPKPWLATFFELKHLDSNLDVFGKNRSLADYSMAHWLFQKRPDKFTGEITDLPDQLANAGLRLNIPGTAQVFANKDMTAAYVSAMSTVLAYMGWGGALGNDDFGSFLLPGTGLWHPTWRDSFGSLPDKLKLDFNDAI